MLFAFVYLFSVSIHAQNSSRLYTTIQNIYNGNEKLATNDCNAVNSLIEELQEYEKNTLLVPEVKAYTIRYPKRIDNPTIGDLTKDRILRIKGKFESCFENKALSSYNTVQDIYLQHNTMSSSNCTPITNLISELEKHTSNLTAVPTSKAQTVSFPNKVENPTIGDLAKDRIARLKSKFKSCFDDKNKINVLFKNTLGTWKYKHNGKEFEVLIEEKDDVYVASFKKHGYSYAPVYKKTITSFKSLNSLEDRIRFTFELSSKHYVSLRFAVNNSKVSAYIYESWKNTNSWSTLEIEDIKVTREESRVIVRSPKAVAITFYNQTKSTALVFLINAEGEEIKKRILKSGEAYVQDAFSSDKWKIRQKRSDTIEYTTTADASQLVRIK